MHTKEVQSKEKAMKSSIFELQKTLNVDCIKLTKKNSKDEMK